MRKIHDFSSFSALYESDAVPAGTPTTSIGSIFKDVKATESSKLYDQTLGLILTTALNSYSSELTFPVKSYDANIDADMMSVKSAPVEEKPEALKKIMEKVKSASSDNTSKGAQDAVDAWVAAGTKAADALEAMINQYKDQPEELTHINDYVNAKIDSYLKGIEDSAKSNDLKNLIAKKNESSNYEGSDEIFEGIFQGKKGLIEDVSKQVTLVTAKLASLAQTPGMSADVQKLQTEVNQIAAKMGDLLDKKNSEINKSEVKKAAERLAEIPTEADKIAEKMLKQDATNKEAAAVLVQALALVQDAKNKEIAYLENKEVEDKANKENLKAVVVEYNPEKTKNENPKVKEFQQLVTDKFKNIKSISGLPQFKKMGVDGKFGTGTAEMVKIIKSGYGLENPSSSDLTNELYAELKKDEVIKESESRILSFHGYVRLNEDFNVSAALDTAKSLRSTSSAVAKSKSASGTKKAASAKAPEKTTEDFNTLADDKKWEWLSTYDFVKNDSEGQVSKAEAPSEYNGQKLRRVFYKYTSSSQGDPVVTVLYSPVGGKSPKYTDYSFANGKAGDVIEQGTWGRDKNGYVTWDVVYKNPKYVGTKTAKLANDLYYSVEGAGTDEEKFLGAIQKIDNLNLLKAVNAKLKEKPYKLDIQGWINDDFDSGNTATLNSVVDALNKIKGVSASFQKDGDGDFKEETFKLVIK